MKNSWWLALRDTCACNHLRLGHATLGKGKCRITNCKCKKFKLQKEAFSSPESELGEK